MYGPRSLGAKCTRRNERGTAMRVASAVLHNSGPPILATMREGQTCMCAGGNGRRCAKELCTLTSQRETEGSRVGRTRPFVSRGGGGCDVWLRVRPVTKSKFLGGLSRFFPSSREAICSASRPYTTQHASSYMPSHNVWAYVGGGHTPSLLHSRLLHLLSLIHI